MRRWLPVLLALLVQGCTSTAVYEPSSLWYYISVGSVVELHEELVVPLRYTRVYLQDGEVWGYGQVDKYYPFCNFEVWDRKETDEQVIKPDRFIVTKVEQGWRRIVGLDHHQLAGAAMRNRFRHWIIWKDGPDDINRYWHYWLGSDTQPNVMRLTCYGGQGEWHAARQPTLSQVREHLGGKVTIHLNP